MGSRRGESTSNTKLEIQDENCCAALSANHTLLQEDEKVRGEEEEDKDR